MNEFDKWYATTNPNEGLMTAEEMEQKYYDECYEYDPVLAAAERGPVPYNWEAQQEMLRDDYLGLMDGYSRCTTA